MRITIFFSIHKIDSGIYILKVDSTCVHVMAYEHAWLSLQRMGSQLSGLIIYIYFQTFDKTIKLLCSFLFYTTKNSIALFFSF